MSTILIAGILIGGAVGLPLFFMFISKRNTRKGKQKKLDFFRDAGSKNGLLFSRQEILENKIIGLDEANRTLLIYGFKNDYNVSLINMTRVRNCTVRKSYENLNFGNEKKVMMEQHLAAIDILFVFKSGGDEPFALSFYDSTVNSIYEMAELEAKAKDWETILTRMLIKKFQAAF